MPRPPSFDDYEHIQKEEFDRLLDATSPVKQRWWQGPTQEPETQYKSTSEDMQTVRDAIVALPRPRSPHLKQHGATSDARPRSVSAGRFDVRESLPTSSAPNLASPARQQTSHNTEQPQVGLKHDPSQMPLLTDTMHFDVLEDALQAEHDDLSDDAYDMTAIQRDYDAQWVLNLSMHFRDKSKKEKFFITYAQSPTFWRRMTISIDYKNLFPGSLEAELEDLHYQRDKSFRVFKALHESLPAIQFFDTVTNLKLETTDDGQLHVHVREDGNEIIDYPSVSVLEHVECSRYTESQLVFDSHISGFVYKVKVYGKVYIKKEVPGTDSIDEFIYEVNALDALQDSTDVMRLAALITDNDGEVVKGLLVEYAEQGALVDALYDWEPEELPWSLRLKWAKQIIRGLAAIHECGFVQGDFTLSNIVIDKDKDVHIIDINRRGCPIGWEPPELNTLIVQAQRVSMYIGVKTDIYQLGMVLWALARITDEPDRIDRPLPSLGDDVPELYRQVVENCLQEKPKDRTTAAKLLHLIEQQLEIWSASSRKQHSASSKLNEIETGDPAHAEHGLEPLPYRDGCITTQTSTSHEDMITSTMSLTQPLHEILPPSWPSEITEDLVDAQGDALPPFYHKPRHEDSGFVDGPTENSLRTICEAGTTRQNDDIG